MKGNWFTLMKKCTILYVPDGFNGREAIGERLGVEVSYTISSTFYEDIYYLNL